MREPGYYVVLSRLHAEELLPALTDEALERVGRLTADFGAVLVDLRADTLGEIRVLNNGLELARLKR